mmetsp:Transcript_122620/g.392487  ORF Transcript_122620/g.392487 Transcript_122620/m.392487 type:complete len:204 (+) Transcript_122620:458-1069(+)
MRAQGRRRSRHGPRTVPEHGLGHSLERAGAFPACADLGSASYCRALGRRATNRSVRSFRGGCFDASAGGAQRSGLVRRHGFADVAAPPRHGRLHLHLGAAAALGAGAGLGGAAERGIGRARARPLQAVRLRAHQGMRSWSRMPLLPPVRAGRAQGPPQAQAGRAPRGAGREEGGARGSPLNHSLWWRGGKSGRGEEMETRQCP